ncbi:tRNA (guanine(9)-N1)-methyltransferase [Armadillidium nasatum]|uniref:RNA (guanine-9-)-methyltransferase domain-containing protein 1 n=1 Tax=Armadillidium nasatum TaxID=96803 RepID=A0A5N5SX62_9CRUS|nr:tRNA (guanine(9)-N1)-methyltransferase [Armadillidium nasatum]
MFNQPLVIDLDFYDYMKRREVTSLSEQLKISISRNKLSLEPFNLTLCNVDFDCKKYQSLFKFMPNMAEPNFPINVTSESYLDIFPKEKLVYLTPDARDVMERFDHEAIYIIGGLVNLRDSVNVTLGKATRENIKTMKLPIERYHISKKRLQ